MPVVRCPIEGCEYDTPDVDPVLAAALITTHATVHAAPHSVPPVAKAEKGQQPSIIRWDDRGLAVLSIKVERLRESNQAVGG